MREVNKMDDSNCVDVCLLSNEKIQISQNHTVSYEKKKQNQLNQLSSIF